MIVGSLVLILVAVVLLVLGLMNGSSAMLIGSIGASLLAAVALVVGARQDTATRAGEGYLDDDPLDRVRAGDEDDQVMESYVTAGARAGRAGQRTGYPAGPPPERQPDTPTVTFPAQPREAPREAQVREAHVREAQVREEPVREARDGLRPDVPREAPRDVPPDATVPIGGTAPEDEYAEEDPPDEPAPQVVSPGDTARVARLTTDVLVIDGRPRYHLPGCVHLLGRESEPLPVSEAVELGFTPCSLCEPASALLTDPRQA